MAGDWLKVEVCTPDKPEVIGIADMLGIAPAHAFGSLFMVWRWFDQHTTEGNASYVTKVTIDRLSGNAGFADAMSKVGWLTINSDGTVALPHFDRHNGETAKQRGLTAKRVAKSKSKSNDTGNAPTVTTGVSDALPREEKRREENINSKANSKDLPPPPALPEKKATRLPKDWHLPKVWGEWALAEYPLLNADDIRNMAAIFKDHWLANASRATGKKDDWQATWRNWVRKTPPNRAGVPKPGSMTYHEKLSDTADQIFGRKHGTGNTVIDITPKQAVGGNPENIPAVYVGLRA
jgi:hypothetical protein